VEGIQQFVERVLEEVGAYPIIMFGSALHGSGRSTVADITYKKFVAAGIPARRISTGKIFREIAESEELTIEEFMALQQSDPPRFYSLNIGVDQRIHEEMEEKSLNEAIIIDSNLAAYHVEIPNAYALLVYAKPEIVGSRVFQARRKAEREYRSPEDALKEMVERTRADIDLYRKMSEIARDNFWKMVYRIAAKDMEKNLETILRREKPESPFFHATVDNNGTLEETWKNVEAFLRSQR